MKNTQTRSRSRRIIFVGQRVLEDRDYPLSLSEKDCRHLVDAVLTEEQKARLEAEHSLAFELPLPGRGRGRIFATSHEGSVSALITVSC